MCELCDCFLESVALIELGLKWDILSAADGNTYSRSPFIHNYTQQTICGFDVDKQPGVISAYQDLSG